METTNVCKIFFFFCTMGWTEPWFRTDLTFQYFWAVKRKNDSWSTLGKVIPYHNILFPSGRGKGEERGIFMYFLICWSAGSVLSGKDLTVRSRGNIPLVKIALNLWKSAQPARKTAEKAWRLPQLSSTRTAGIGGRLNHIYIYTYLLQQ